MSYADQCAEAERAAKSAIDKDGLVLRVEALESQLKEAHEVIGFYNCYSSKPGQTVQAWDDHDYEPKYLGEIPKDDFEILAEGSDSCNVFLGKRAREYQEKWKVKNGEQ